VAASVRTALRVPDGADLAAIDPGGLPVGPRDKQTAERQTAEIGVRLDGLQERLYAEGTRALLLVLQGMDTAGKGGTIRHVAGLMNPQGLQVSSFGRPTEAERAEHYLARIRRAVPRSGRIGVFDRSHYEDVLVVRVEKLVPESVWHARYDELAAFEDELSRSGITVMKCLLHISPQEQQRRLLARLDDRTKRWKYDPSDVDARAKWHGYQQAYGEALRRCDSDDAPWYVVPADRKWYRNWAVAALLAETLAGLDPRYPAVHLDVAAEKARLRASTVG